MASHAEKVTKVAKKKGNQKSTPNGASLKLEDDIVFNGTRPRFTAFLRKLVQDYVDAHPEMTFAEIADNYDRTAAWLSNFLNRVIKTPYSSTVENILAFHGCFMVEENGSLKVVMSKSASTREEEEMSLGDASRKYSNANGFSKIVEEHPNGLKVTYHR